MLVDKRLEFSDAQALSSTGPSTNIVDLGSDRDIGQGRPMFLVVTCDVALAGTSPTLAIALQTDDNSGFSSPKNIVNSETFSALAAGDKVVLPVPYDNEEFLRVNYTLGGTSPTVTLSAWLTDQEPESWDSYPDAI